MFKAVKFDFDAFHNQSLPSPFQKKWSDPEYMAADDFGLDRLDRGNLGLDAGDSIFIQSTAFDAEAWDAKF